ncbi:unnamed protein product [Discosporangium mesarthrocarpum]
MKSSRSRQGLQGREKISPVDALLRSFGSSEGKVDETGEPRITESLEDTLARVRGIEGGTTLKGTRALRARVEELEMRLREERKKVVQLEARLIHAQRTIVLQATRLAGGGGDGSCPLKGTTPISIPPLPSPDQDERTLESLRETNAELRAKLGLMATGAAGSSSRTLAPVTLAPVTNAKNTRTGEQLATIDKPDSPSDRVHLEVSTIVGKGPPIFEAGGETHHPEAQKGQPGKRMRDDDIAVPHQVIG